MKVHRDYITGFLCAVIGVLVFLSVCVPTGWIHFKTQPEDVLKSQVVTLEEQLLECMDGREKAIDAAQRTLGHLNRCMELNERCLDTLNGEDSLPVFEPKEKLDI